MYFCGGHYRQPVEYDEERLADAAPASRASVRPRGGCPVRARLVGRPLRSGSSSARRGLQHAAGPRGRFDWVREANRADREPVGDADLREMLDVLGLANLLSGSERARLPAELAAGSARAARAERDYAEADRLRAEIEALGWEVRDGPDGPELLAVVIVYGRNPVREAIRGPRTVSRLWATKNAAREAWVRRSGR